MGPRKGIVAILALCLLGFASARVITPSVDAAPDACQACLVSVRILEDFLCDPAATDFLVEFVEKQICPAMGDTAQCHNLAEGLLPTLVQWFRASATPASLCASAGVCGAQLAAVPSLTKPALRVHDGAECAMCRFVVDRVKTALNDSQTLEKIKEVALQVCGGLPAELANSCSDFVNSYEPMIAQLIESMDPDTVCGLMGVCMEALVARPPLPLPAALVRALADSKILSRPPPPPLFAIMAQLGMPAPFMPHAHGPEGGMMGGVMRGMGMGPRDGPHPMPMGGAMNDACDYCKMAVIEARSLVSNPSVQAEVLNYTLAMCDGFPSFAAPCKTYVTLYAPLVFTMLEQYLVPDTVCAQTGMCPPSRGMESEAAVQLLPPTHEPHSPLGWLLEGLRSVGERLGLLPPPPRFGATAAALHRAEPEPEAAPRVKPPQ